MSELHFNDFLLGVLAAVNRMGFVGVFFMASPTSAVTGALIFFVLFFASCGLSEPKTA
jgi:hypothetical protein